MSEKVALELTTSALNQRRPECESLSLQVTNKDDGENRNHTADLTATISSDDFASKLRFCNETKLLDENDNSITQASAVRHSICLNIKSPTTKATADANCESWELANSSVKMVQQNGHNLLREKVQSLPLLCVESICRFTPTSKLIRLYSNAVPLPGAFWSFGLEAVLKKRLPLSISKDLSYQAEDPEATALFDALGARVASIKRPEFFRFSPLGELVKSATLTVLFTYRKDLPDRQPKLFLMHGEARLAPLPKITALCLDLREARSPSDETHLRNGNLLEQILADLRPHLNSFAIDWREYSYCPGLDDLLDQIVREMLSLSPNNAPLRRLLLPDAGFRGVLQSAHSAKAQCALSGLSTLSIWREDYEMDWPSVRRDTLGFLSAYCGHLSTLFVPVYVDFVMYLDAFRALPGLTTLGLNVDDSAMHGAGIDGQDSILSVVDLRFISSAKDAVVFAVASLFPNAKAFAFQPCILAGDVLDLSWQFCVSLPAVEKLVCFIHRELQRCSAKRLAEFLANPNLPEAVDLSQIVFENVACDADALTAIYYEMQKNSIKHFLLRGPVQREGLSRLRSHIGLHGEQANFVAWNDRDLGDQVSIAIDGFAVAGTEFLQQTDIRIVGIKISGSSKGEPFTMRVLHQLTPRRHIFD